MREVYVGTPWGGEQRAEGQCCDEQRIVALICIINCSSDEEEMQGSEEVVTSKNSENESRWSGRDGGLRRVKEER